MDSQVVNNMAESEKKSEVYIKSVKLIKNNIPGAKIPCESIEK